MSVWTHGRWTVKPGREEEFVDAWWRLAREAVAAFETPGPPTLLRDRARPNVFLSFGPWESVEQVERFRAELVGPAMSRFEPLLEGFESFTLDEARSDD